MKTTDTPTGYMIAQCQLIILDENEPPTRRRLAQRWLDRLLDQVSVWGNDGKTMAESAGIEIPAGAPGGSRLAPAGGAGGRKVTAQNIDGHGGLSSEVTGGYRSGRWAAERSER